MHADDRLTLALAIARSPRARIISPDNSASRSLRLGEAIASGNAYFVVPRAELLALDMDLPDDPTRTADVVASFELLMDTAAKHGVPHLTLPSGRRGHSHGYLVAGTGPARSRLERWCKSRGLDVRNQGIRPPGSPHRSGRGEAWTSDLSMPDAIAILSALPTGHGVEKLAADLCPPPQLPGRIQATVRRSRDAAGYQTRSHAGAALAMLPGRVQTAVRRGHDAAGYPTPSHGRMALAVGARARGGSRDLVEMILRDPLSPLGGSFRDKDPRWQRAELTRIWNKAGTWIEDRGFQDPHDHLHKVAAAAGTWPWRGTGGGSDLAVLEELLRIAVSVPTTVVGASMGNLAIGAGVSIDTVRSALRRLGTAGWLRVADQETPTTTRTYELLVPDAADTTGDSQIPIRDEFGDLGADIARWRGLGKVTMRVARTVSRSSGISTVDLGKTLGMAVATLRHHLRKLASAGLLTGHHHRWSLASHTRQATEKLARNLGVAGSRERQTIAIAHRAKLRAQSGAKFRAERMTRMWGRDAPKKSRSVQDQPDTT